MLVFKRKPKENVIINLCGLVTLIKNNPQLLEDILSKPLLVAYMGQKGYGAVIGFEADPLIVVDRQEVHKKKEVEKHGD